MRGREGRTNIRCEENDKKLTLIKTTAKDDRIRTYM